LIQRIGSVLEEERITIGESKNEKEERIQETSGKARLREEIKGGKKLASKRRAVGDGGERLAKLGEG
jgi:hypothetical protein